MCKNRQHDRYQSFMLSFYLTIVTFRELYISEKQTLKALIRLLLQKQSDLGLPYLSRPFWYETSFQKFRTFTITVAGVQIFPASSTAEDH